MAIILDGYNRLLLSRILAFTYNSFLNFEKIEFCGLFLRNLVTYTCINSGDFDGDRNKNVRVSPDYRCSGGPVGTKDCLTSERHMT